MVGLRGDRDDRVVIRVSCSGEGCTVRVKVALSV